MFVCHFTGWGKRYLTLSQTESKKIFFQLAVLLACTQQGLTGVTVFVSMT